MKSESSNSKRSAVFQLKHFELNQRSDVFKIGTDTMILGAWLETDFVPNSILDLGTGTGILSLMMAQKFPDAQIVGVDSNLKAVELSRENFKRNTLGKYCTSEHSTFKNFTAQTPFELIVSNPPYFVNSKVAESAVNSSAKHLDTNDLHEFFLCASRNLSVNGIIAMVHPASGHFEKAALECGFFVIRELQVFGTQGRLVRVCNLYARQERASVTETIIIRCENGAYSEDYKALTAAFHGKTL